MIHVLNKVKDKALQSLLRWFLNTYHLDRLGTITNLAVDSGAKNISIELNLDGESGPIRANVHYAIIDPTTIELTRLDCSRGWIATLFNELVPKDQKRREVPRALVRALTNLI